MSSRKRQPQDLAFRAQSGHARHRVQVWLQYRRQQFASLAPRQLHLPVEQGSALCQLSFRRGSQNRRDYQSLMTSRPQIQDPFRIFRTSLLSVVLATCPSTFAIALLVPSPLPQAIQVRSTVRGIAHQHQESHSTNSKQCQRTKRSYVVDGCDIFGHEE